MKQVCVEGDGRGFVGVLLEGNMAVHQYAVLVVCCGCVPCAFHSILSSLKLTEVVLVVVARVSSRARHCCLRGFMYVV